MRLACVDVPGESLMLVTSGVHRRSEGALVTLPVAIETGRLIHFIFSPSVLEAGLFGLISGSRCLCHSKCVYYLA